MLGDFVEIAKSVIWSAIFLLAIGWNIAWILLKRGGSRTTCKLLIARVHDHREGCPTQDYSYRVQNKKIRY